MPDTSDFLNVMTELDRQDVVRFDLHHLNAAASSGYVALVKHAGVGGAAYRDESGVLMIQCRLLDPVVLSSYGAASGDSSPTRQPLADLARLQKLREALKVFHDTVVNHLPKTMPNGIRLCFDVVGPMFADNAEGHAEHSIRVHGLQDLSVDEEASWARIEAFCGLHGIPTADVVLHGFDTFDTDEEVYDLARVQHKPSGRQAEGIFIRSLFGGSHDSEIFWKCFAPNPLWSDPVSRYVPPISLSEIDFDDPDQDPLRLDDGCATEPLYRED